MGPFRSVSQPRTFFIIDDELWIDMSPENLFTHNQVKRAVAFALNLLADETKLGR